MEYSSITGIIIAFPLRLFDGREKGEIGYILTSYDTLILCFKIFYSVFTMVDQWWNKYFIFIELNLSLQFSLSLDV